VDTEPQLKRGSLLFVEVLNPYSRQFGRVWRGFVRIAGKRSIPAKVKLSISLQHNYRRLQVVVFEYERKWKLC
jgi:hypothetical protein